MKNNNPKIILTLFSVIIGIFIATQMKLNVQSYAPVTISSIQSMKSEINSINEEIKSLEKVIKNKEEELETLINIAKGDDNIINILSEDINKNKINSGKSKVKGQGIIITMYDNPAERMPGFDINDDVIHDLDILTIVNDLKIAGAEAISINGERVISTSEIKCGGPTIRVNGRSSAVPFVIKAIGDSKLLNASVTAPGTYGDILKSVYQVGFDTSVEDSIIIPAYSGRFDFKYAKPLGEGD
jgi:uncharacterized protein YlxW (UPF0749 family)